MFYRHCLLSNLHFSHTLLPNKSLFSKPSYYYKHFPSHSFFKQKRCNNISTKVAATHYVLQFNFVENMVEKRKPYREAHLKQLDNESEKGNVVVAGAAGDPVDSGLMLFKNVTSEYIEEFAKADPYVLNGLVTSWTVKPINLVIGQDK